MSALDAFRQELEKQIAAAASASRWQAAEVAAYMTAYRERYEQFDAAQDLLESIARPRLEALAELFPSARVKTAAHPRNCGCWFATSDRFPVTAMIEFKTEHDEPLEHLYLRYEACFLPAFHQFQPHDRLALPLAGIDRDRIAEWVEERIFEFLRAYLQYDRGYEELDEDLVTDSVCGMPIRRGEATGQVSYRGHPYFFCSPECQAKFQAHPTDYVVVRTM